MKKERSEKVPSIDLNEAREYLLYLLPQLWEKVLKELYDSGVFTVKEKDGVNYSIDADDRSDEYLIKHISDKFPDTEFLTEETAQKDYLRFKNVEDLWVIDALDGTTNFKNKRPHFGISVALVKKGLPRLGVVYLPLQNELYTATEGTVTLLNGKEIGLSQTRDLQKAWLESGVSWDMDKRDEFAIDWIPKLFKNTRAFTMSGSSVFDMARVAKGELDGFVFCGIKPWDQAATGLIIQNAGGVITSADGKVWNVFQEDIIAGNRFIHPKILDLIGKNH